MSHVNHGFCQEYLVFILEITPVPNWPFAPRLAGNGASDRRKVMGVMITPRLPASTTQGASNGILVEL